jgi:hypothetical protein
MANKEVCSVLHFEGRERGVLVRFYFWMWVLLTQVCSFGESSLHCAHIIHIVSPRASRLQ